VAGIQKKIRRRREKKERAKERTGVFLVF